jgi:hypothetical protein
MEKLERNFVVDGTASATMQPLTLSRAKRNNPI